MAKDTMNEERKKAQANEKNNNRLISEVSPEKYLGYFPLANILNTLDVEEHFFINGEPTWTSSNDDIIDISEDGKVKAVKAGEEIHFIEIMGCPGGCVNGGGQPQVPASVRNFTDIRAERAKALYTLDEKNTIRFSHENPDVKELYASYLGEPGSHKAHDLLHTTYVKRKIHEI